MLKLKTKSAIALVRSMLCACPMSGTRHSVVELCPSLHTVTSVHRHTDITAFVSISKITFWYGQNNSGSIVAAGNDSFHSGIHLSNAPGLKPIFKSLLFSNVPCALHLIYHFLFLTLLGFSFPAWFRCMLPLGSPFSLFKTLLLRLHVCTDAQPGFRMSESPSLSL